MRIPGAIVDAVLLHPEQRQSYAVDYDPSLSGEERRPGCSGRRNVLRSGMALGEREGTGPDDDPLLGAQRRRSRAEGYADGQAKERPELARALLAARGIEVSAGFPGVPGFAELPHHAIAEAASSCVSEADFQQRLRRR